MQFLAISGSARRASTNTALLQSLARFAAPDHQVLVFNNLAGLPVFSPDLEGKEPEAVLHLARQISRADGLIISSPEYVHAIPGGLKNAIDWMVSRDELVGKPIALAHASHRGESVLDQLRIVLSTVSDRFTSEPFLRIPIVKHSPEEVVALTAHPDNAQLIRDFLDSFALYCSH